MMGAAYTTDCADTSDTSTRGWVTYPLSTTETTDTSPTVPIFRLLSVDYANAIIKASVEPLIEEVLTPPKAWRWYHVFRSFVESRLPERGNEINLVIRRVQERYSRLQRVRWKRRRFVQRLME
jgi:hypothetical protein